MTKKKEIELLISRYKADIAALEDRREDLMRHIEVLRNLIPSVQVWHMWKTFQKVEFPYTAGSPFPEEDIAKAREHLAHLERVLEELQQAVELIIEEENVIKKRMDVLEKSSEDQKDLNTILQWDPDDMVGKELPDLQIGTPAAVEGLTRDKVMHQDNTDWKKVCENLVKQVGELSDNLKDSSKKLKENESYAKRLEKEYFMLERELEIQIQKLEGKNESMIEMILEKDEIKGWEEGIEGKKTLSSMQGALAEVRSMKNTLSKSGIVQKVASVVKSVASKDSKSVKIGRLPPPPQAGVTDWKKLCQDLLKQVSELSKKVKNSSQQLKESEKYAKYLEDECAKLEEELQLKIKLLQKTGEPTSEKNSQKDLEKKKMLTAIEGALEDVKSLQSALEEAKSIRDTLSKVTKQSKDVKTPQLSTAPSEDTGKVSEKADITTNGPSVSVTEVKPTITSEGPSVASLEAKLSDKAQNASKAPSTAATEVEVKTSSKNPTVASLKAKLSDKAQNASKAPSIAATEVEVKTSSKNPTVASLEAKLSGKLDTALKNPSVATLAVKVETTSKGPSDTLLDGKVSEKLETTSKIPSVTTTKVEVETTSKGTSVASSEPKLPDKTPTISPLVPNSSVFDRMKSKMPASDHISVKTEGGTVKGEVISPPEQTKAQFSRHMGLTPSVAKKKEVDMLIARYMADISALEERKEHLLRQIELREFLKPSIFTYHMSKMYERVEIPPTTGTPISQNEIEEEAKEKLKHLQSETEELLEAVGLVEEEEKLIRKRIEDLGKGLTDLPEKFTDRKTDTLATSDGMGEEAEEQSQAGDTDWKNLSDKLLIQVSELNEKILNSSKQLEESEVYAKHLEEEISKLEKALEEQIKLLGEKADKPISVDEKERDKYLEEELEKKDYISVMEEALEEVRSMRGSLEEAKSIRESLSKVISTESKVQGQISSESIKKGTTLLPVTSAIKEPKELADTVLEKSEVLLIAGSHVSNKEGETDLSEDPAFKSVKTKSKISIISRPEIISGEISTEGEIIAPSETTPEEKEASLDTIKQTTEGLESTKEGKTDLSEEPVLKSVKEDEETKSKKTITSRSEIISGEIPTEGEIIAPSDTTPEEKETSPDTIKQITDVLESTKEDETDLSEEAVLKSVKEDEETKSKKSFISGPEIISGEISTKAEISAPSAATPEEKEPSLDTIKRKTDVLENTKEGETDLSEESVLKSLKEYQETKSKKSFISEISTKGEISVSSEASPEEKEASSDVKQITYVPESTKEGEEAPSKEPLPTSGTEKVSSYTTPTTGEIIVPTEKPTLEHTPSKSDIIQVIPSEPGEIPTEGETIVPSQAVPVMKEASLDIKQITVPPKSTKAVEETSSKEPSPTSGLEKVSSGTSHTVRDISGPSEKPRSGDEPESLKSVKTGPQSESGVILPKSETSVSSKAAQVENEASPEINQMTDVLESIKEGEKSPSKVPEPAPGPGAVLADESQAKMETKLPGVSFETPDEGKTFIDIPTDEPPKSETVSKTTRTESPKSPPEERRLKPILSEPTGPVSEVSKIAEVTTSGKPEEKLQTEIFPIVDRSAADVIATAPFEKSPPTLKETPVFETKLAVTADSSKKPSSDEALVQALVSKHKEALTADIKDVPTIQKEPTPSDKKPSVSDLTGEMLQNKLKLKDHLIKTMADQLRDLAHNNKWPEKKKFEDAAGRDPVATYDFDKNSLLLYLKGDEPPDLSKSLKSNPQYSGSNPLNVKIVRKIDHNSLMIEWGPPPSADVAGFQIFVNGQFLYWVHSAKRNLALLHPLDLKVLTEISVSPIDEKGNIIYRSNVTYKPD